MAKKQSKKATLKKLDKTGKWVEVKTSSNHLNGYFDFLETQQKRLSEMLEVSGIDIAIKLSQVALNIDIPNPLENLKSELEKTRKDKEICENDNLWYNLTLNELESREMEVKHLKEKLKEQEKTIKAIHHQTNIYFKIDEVKNSHISFTHYSNEIHYFRIMLKPLIDLLFHNTKPFQWECILKGETPPEPIQAHPETELKEIRLFFDLLRDNEIIKKNYISKLVQLKAIYFNSKPIEKAQLITARKENNIKLPKRANIIYDSFKGIK